MHRQLAVKLALSYHRVWAVDDRRVSTLYAAGACHAMQCHVLPVIINWPAARLAPHATAPGDDKYAVNERWKERRETDGRHVMRRGR